MAVVLMLVGAVLVCTLPFLGDAMRAAEYWLLVEPVIGKWLGLSPVLWWGTFVLWFNACGWWLLKRRAEKRKAQAAASKAAALKPMAPPPSGGVLSVVAEPEVAAPAVAAPAVVAPAVAAPKRSAVVLASAGRAAVATVRFVGDKMSLDKRADRHRLANYAKVVAEEEAEKRLKKVPIATMIGKKGRPLHLVMESRGVYVLTDKTGHVVHRLLAKTEALAKREMLGY